MKTLNRTRGDSALFWLAGFLSLLLFLAQPARVLAQAPPGPTLPTPLASWSFHDTNYWTSDQSYSPISFTNISWSDLGDYWSLDVDTNVPAWLNYYIYDPTNEATNLIVNAAGSITFWYGPNWATTNDGPGNWAQLIDVGEWTSNSSYGYWGLSIDPTGSNIVFLSQDGLGDTYDLYSPISWTTNYFHFIGLTYSSTNVSLYLDGQLATNDPGGLGLWPNSDVLSNGVFFGSDMNGNEQAQGLFNTIQTYSSNLDSGTIQSIYGSQNFYDLMPIESAIMGAPSNPSTNSTAPDAITGAGLLQWDGTNANCRYSANGYNVSITNLVVTPSTNGLMNVTFSINGGTNGWFYDVFATGQLETPLPSNATWSWMGQGLACNTYTFTIPITNAPDCFLILGTPWDSSGADLTDAYQLLVSKTNPDINDSDVDGLITGWEILLGLNPHISNIGNPLQQVKYNYTPADWIDGISGIKGNSSITMDNEGNVLTVSQ